MARILVVDDSLIMRRNLRVMLSEAGHEVVAEASNGTQAVQEYEKICPDLVTMDITMPGMNGIEAVKKIVAFDPNAKIIMVSALDMKHMVFEALESGAKHYIIKPVTVEKVVSVVNKVLGDNRVYKGISLSQTVLPKPNNDDNTPPFAIENNNGTFIVRIGRNITLAGIASINTAVQGFLYIKPLKIAFDFGNIEVLEDTLLEKLLDIMVTVKKNDGTIKILCNNEKLDILVHGKFRDAMKSASR